MFSLGLLVEMDGAELEINHRIGYKYDVASVNKEWQNKNEEVDEDCSCGLSKSVDSLFNTDQSVEPVAKGLLNVDMTEKEATLINYIRAVRNKEVITEFNNYNNALYSDQWKDDTIA